jgi:hypothetical protein
MTAAVNRLQRFVRDREFMIDRERQPIQRAGRGWRLRMQPIRPPPRLVRYNKCPATVHGLLLRLGTRLRRDGTCCLGLAAPGVPCVGGRK